MIHHGTASATNNSKRDHKVIIGRRNNNMTCVTDSLTLETTTGHDKTDDTEQN